MTLATQMLADVDDVFLVTDEHAETVTYQPEGGAPKSVKVIWEPMEEIDPTFGADGKYRKMMATVFMDADSTLGIVTPKEGDKIVRSGVTWIVDQGKSDAAGMHELKVVSNVHVEKSGPEHRIKR